MYWDTMASKLVLELPGRLRAARELASTLEPVP